MFAFLRPGRRRARSFPPAWDTYLATNVAVYRTMPPDGRARLRARTLDFLRRTHFEGCQGLRLTDEMRVTIGAQACLLGLGFDPPLPDGVRTILLYAGGFLVGDPYEFSDRIQHLTGQAVHRGPVILSWWHARWDARRRRPRNLVLHEFAHKLAELNDNPPGTPPMPNPEFARRWEAVMAAAFDRLCADVDRDRPTLLDPYGATSRIEFFPICVEAFFHQPVRLCAEHPDLYGALVEWFRQDPATQWALPTDDDDSVRAEAEYTRHALAECAAALRLRPEDPEAYHARGSIRWATGDLDGAEADFTTALDLEPDDANLLCRRGDLRASRERSAEALDDYEAALKLCPELTPALLGRGSAFHVAGDLCRAEADFTAVIRIDPDEDEAYSLRGHVRMDRRDVAGALADYEAAVRRWPTRATQHSDMAAAAVCVGDHDKARAAADEAIRLDPNLPEPFKHRGAAQFHRGEYEAAVADLTEAIRRDPKYGWAYAYRALAHAALGDSAAARADQAKAEELDPNPDPSLP